MELTFGSSFTMALLSCLYIALVTTPVVSGKCRGKWAIHACWGGNGKRSDPNLGTQTAPQVPRSLLRSLLVSDVERLSQLLEDVDSSKPGPGFDAAPFNEKTESAAARVEEDMPLRKLSKYIRALKLRRALSDNTDDNLI